MVSQQQGRVCSIIKLVRAKRCSGSIGGSILGRQVGKGKNILIEHNVARNIHAICRNMETFVAFVEGAVTKEDTFFSSETQVCEYYMGEDEANMHSQKLLERYNQVLHLRDAL
jgi:hypothetical protein